MVKTLRKMSNSCSDTTPSARAILPASAMMAMVKVTPGSESRSRKKCPATAPTSAPTTVPSSEPTQTTTKPVTQPPPVTQSTQPVADRPAAEVYNNTPRKGLADQVANRARQAGWTVSGIDNWHGKIVGSTVYYPPGMEQAANQLARDLGIGRTKEALDNMKKDRLTVILTSDYSG